LRFLPGEENERCQDRLRLEADVDLTALTSVPPRALALAVQGATIEQPTSVYDTRGLLVI
jgi:hypothetical protein